MARTHSPCRVQIIIHCILDDPRCKFQEEDPYCRQYKMDLLRLIPYLLRAGEQKSQPKKAEPIQTGCWGPLAAKTHGHVDVMESIILLEEFSPARAGDLLELIWTFARLHVFSLGDTLDIGMQEHCQLHPVDGLTTTWSCLVSVTFNYCKLVMRWPDGKFPGKLPSLPPVSVDASRSGPIYIYVLSANKGLATDVNEDSVFQKGHISELVEIAARNVDATLTAMLTGTCDRDMWFWEAFAGVVVCTKFRRSFYELPRNLQDTEKTLYRNIKTWSRIMGVTTWEDAKKVLQKIVWYYNGPEEIARATWERIVPPPPDTVPGRYKKGQLGQC